MKVIYNNTIPFKWYLAINLFGILFARKEYKPLDKYTINHEAIHTAQMKELGYIGFYIIYLLEWFMRIIQYESFHKAYRNISFEKEAYNNEKRLDYIYTRKHYNQWK